MSVTGPGPRSGGTLPGLPPPFSRDPLSPQSGGSLRLSLSLPSLEPARKQGHIVRNERVQRELSRPARSQQRERSPASEAEPDRRPAARGAAPPGGDGTPAAPSPARGLVRAAIYRSLGQPGRQAGTGTPSPPAPWCQPGLPAAAASGRIPRRKRGRCPAWGMGANHRMVCAPPSLAKKAKKGRPAAPCPLLSSVPAPSSLARPLSPSPQPCPPLALAPPRAPLGDGAGAASTGPAAGSPPRGVCVSISAQKSKGREKA